MTRYQRIALAFSLLALPLCLLSACGQQTAQAGQDVYAEEADPTEDIYLSLSFGVTDAHRDQEGRKLPLEYNGGTMEVEYSFTASGIGKSVGFLVFLDGIPQPWRLDGAGESAYMHCLELEQDDDERTFTIAFDPVTGSSGDALTLTVCCIIGPEWQPDLETLIGYVGWYHDASSDFYTLRFNADPETAGEADSVAALSQPSLTYADRDEELDRLLEEKNTTGLPLEQWLTQNLQSFLFLDGQERSGSMAVGSAQTVHVTYQLCGAASTWRVALYADDQLLSDGTDCWWELDAAPGEAATLEADILTELLGDKTTLYLIACPVSSDSSDCWLRQSEPVLLYKGSSGLQATDTASASAAGYGKLTGLLSYDRSAGTLTVQSSVAENPDQAYFSYRVELRDQEGSLLNTYTNATDTVFVRGALRHAVVFSGLPSPTYSVFVTHEIRGGSQYTPAAVYTQIVLG